MKNKIEEKIRKKLNILNYSGKDFDFSKWHKLARKTNFYPVVALVSDKFKKQSRGSAIQANTIFIYADKYETKESLFWIFCHEFSHLYLEKNPMFSYYLSGKPYDELKALIEKTKDYKKYPFELKALFPDEICACMFACEIVGKDYGDEWYRRRKELVDKKTIKKLKKKKHKEENYIDFEPDENFMEEKDGK